MEFKRDPILEKTVDVPVGATFVTKLSEVKVGDIVKRMLAGIVPRLLRVTDVTYDVIICGGTRNDHHGWWFDKATGAEIDDGLGWGPPPLMTGSFLVSDTPVVVKTMNEIDALAMKLNRTPLPSDKLN